MIYGDLFFLRRFFKITEFKETKTNKIQKLNIYVAWISKVLINKFYRNTLIYHKNKNLIHYVDE